MYAQTAQTIGITAFQQGRLPPYKFTRRKIDNKLLMLYSINTEIHKYRNTEWRVFMSAKVISFAMQKGGVGKTTTSTLAAFLLSKKGYKVLALDLDQQGNMTQVMANTDDLSTFENETIKEALIGQDLDSYIRVATDNLDFVPADEYLSLLTANYKGDVPVNELLAATIVKVMDDYDFIIIDTPPALGVETLNAFLASDFVVAMFETAKYSYSALPKLLNTIDSVKANGNESLEVLGILATLADGRRSDSKELLELIKEEYQDLVFETVISRKAAVGRLPVYGLFNNPEIKQATQQHAEFLEELIERCQ